MGVGDDVADAASGEGVRGQTAGIRNERAEFLLEAGAIGDKDAEIRRAVFGDTGNPDPVARDFFADGGQFLERSRAFQSTGDVSNPAVPLVEMAELFADEVAEIMHMEAVADLFSLAAIADVGEIPPVVVGHDPVCDNPLIHLTKLPWPGNDPAAVDNNLETVGIAVFLDELLGGKLGVAVERACTIEGDFLADPP